MEDKIYQDRLKNFMKFNIESPKKAREDFMVSLRKSKKQKSFADKRKILMNDATIKSDKLNTIDKIIPGMNNMHEYEGAEEIIKKFKSTIDENEVSQLLECMVSIVNNHWETEYTDLFIEQAIIYRYKSVFSLDGNFTENITDDKSSNSFSYNNKSNILILITNMMHNINSILPVRCKDFIESGLFGELYSNLYLKFDYTQDELTLCSKSLVLFGNMAYTDTMFRDQLKSSKIFQCIADFISIVDLNQEKEFKSNLIFLLESMIKVCSTANLDDLTIISKFIQEELLTETHSKRFPQILIGLAYFLKTNELLLTEKDTVERLISLLVENKTNGNDHLLYGIYGISCFNTNWYDDLAKENLIKGFIKVLKSKTEQDGNKILVLKTLGNLINQEMEDGKHENEFTSYLVSKTDICEHITKNGMSDKQYVAQWCYLLLALIFKSSFSSTETLIERGILGYISIDYSVSLSCEKAGAYLDMLYQLVENDYNMSYQENSDWFSNLISELVENGNINFVESCLDHPNDKISKLANGILNMCKSEVERQGLENCEQEEDDDSDLYQ